MAAGTLPKTGSECGPCEEVCEHTDCAYTRTRAAAKCLKCGEPIGYEVRFYFDGAGAIHAACLEDEIAATRE